MILSKLSSYTSSTRALINISFFYNSCAHVHIMSISYIPSWYHMKDDHISCDLSCMHLYMRIQFTHYTDYCVHKIINRIVYNHSRLHMNLFHSLYYILSTRALIDIILIFNSCAHAYIMSISSIPSWHHKNIDKIRLMPSQIKNGFAEVWLKASRIGNGATVVR